MQGEKYGKQDKKNWEKYDTYAGNDFSIAFTTWYFYFMLFESTFMEYD